MKLRLVLCSVFFYFSVCGQEKNTTYSAFAISDKKVVWVQVYDASQAADSLTTDVYSFLKRKEFIRNAHFDGNDIVADIQNFRVDYKRYGGRYMNTSNLIRTGRWSGKIRVSIKDGRYRVVVYGLEYDARQPALHAGKMNNQPHKIHGTWTDWVLNNYRTHFKKRRHINMDMMHLSLKEGFHLTEADVIDEEW